MDKLVFIGTEKKLSKKDSLYYMLHFGVPVDIEKGSGCIPKSAKIDNEDYAEFKTLETGIEFMGTYETVANSFGGYTTVLKKYAL